MSEHHAKRKLTAIFCADVQGYSRLVGDDEHAKVETITAYRKIMTDLTQSHHGRVVDAKGDNVPAEFSTVVDAVHAAAEIQRELGTKNVDLPEHRRMAFRIGINSGDGDGRQHLLGRRQHCCQAGEPGRGRGDPHFQNDL